MKKGDIKNIHFGLVESTLKGYKSVRVDFNYKGKDESYFIFIEEGKGGNYIAQAKKQFYQDLKSGEVARTLKLISTSKSSRPWLIATASVLGVAAVTFAALFTWKALTNGGESGSSANYVTMTLDAGKGNVIEGSKNEKVKYYIEKGSTFADAFKTTHYVGGSKENEDFLYWSINNQPISGDYVINKSINLSAVYKSVQTDCLTFTAREDNLSISFVQNSDLQISTDHKNWSDTIYTPIVLKHAGDQVYIKRNKITAFGQATDVGMIKFSNKAHSVSGPIEALVNGKTSGLENRTFERCFKADANLVAANNLNLGNITLVEDCYSGMFENCASLITAPKLPAKTLAKECYRTMFQDCTSLTEAPELPATTLATGCYQNMFSSCVSLTEAPELPATTLATSTTTFADLCYASMFYGCTSLTEAPALPATTLAPKCYQYMFSNCSSLTKVPALPAENLKESCYNAMFRNCSSLTEAPALPAEELVDSCYASMFQVCLSLTAAPTLPATTLVEECYDAMFSSCVSLTEAPELPATTLAPNCYQNMFSSCVSLTEAPALPAATLVNGCYSRMFDNCTSLKIREDTSTTTDENKIFTCPDTSSASEPVTDMFRNTSGSFTGGTPNINRTYYYY